MQKAAQSAKEKTGWFSKPEFQKILKEACSNENWNIANTKLQVLADHTYNWDDYNIIMKYLWAKTQSKPKEWRRIFKSLNTLDYLCKNGAPRVVQDLKDDMFKIRNLQDFSFKEGDQEKGNGGK
jgi:epsin